MNDKAKLLRDAERQRTGELESLRVEWMESREKHHPAAVPLDELVNMAINLDADDLRADVEAANDAEALEASRPAPESIEELVGMEQAARRKLEAHQVEAARIEKELEAEQLKHASDVTDLVRKRDGIDAQVKALKLAHPRIFGEPAAPVVEDAPPPLGVVVADAPAEETKPRVWTSGSRPMPMPFAIAGGGAL